MCGCSAWQKLACSVHVWVRPWEICGSCGDHMGNWDYCICWVLGRQGIQNHTKQVSLVLVVYIQAHWKLTVIDYKHFNTVSLFFKLTDKRNLSGLILN